MQSIVLRILFAVFVVSSLGWSFFCKPRVSNLFWQRATAVILGWFAGRTSKNSQAGVYLSSIYSVYMICVKIWPLAA
jgi:hypothetical protein